MCAALSVSLVFLATHSKSILQKACDTKVSGGFISVRSLMCASRHSLLGPLSFAEWRSVSPSALMLEHSDVVDTLTLYANNYYYCPENRFVFTTSC